MIWRIKYENAKFSPFYCFCSTLFVRYGQTYHLDVGKQGFGQNRIQGEACGSTRLHQSSGDKGGQYDQRQHLTLGERLVGKHGNRTGRDIDPHPGDEAEGNRDTCDHSRERHHHCEGESRCRDKGSGCRSGEASFGVDSVLERFRLCLCFGHPRLLCMAGREEQVEDIGPCEEIVIFEVASHYRCAYLTLTSSAICCYFVTLDLRLYRKSFVFSSL